MTSLLIINVGFLQALSYVVLLIIGEPGTEFAGIKMRSFPKTMMAHLERELKNKESHLGLRGTVPQFNLFRGLLESSYVSCKVSLLQAYGRHLGGV
jgi:hypothetical protein